MKVGIRVDGGFRIGLGHIYKSLWLAEVLRKKGYEVVFLTTEDPVSADLIHCKKFSVHPLQADWDEKRSIQAVNEWTQINSPAFLIIDHWDWPAEYWERLEKRPETIFVAVDIPPEGFYKFDLAFQGIRNSLANRDYKQDGCRVHEGPTYLMLSPESQRYCGAWKPTGSLKNILLTFGGTDVADFSTRILDCLKNLPYDFDLTLIVGPGTPNLDAIEAKAANSGLKVNILRNVAGLAEFMCRADLVVSTAGLGSLAELALTGAPAILFAAVPHQTDNADKYSPVGGILNCAQKVGIIDELFIWHLDSLARNPRLLADLSRKWRGLVDAKGLERMADIMENHARNKT